MKAALGFKRLMRRASQDSGLTPDGRRWSAELAAAPVYLVERHDALRPYQAHAEVYLSERMTPPLPHDAFLIEAGEERRKFVLGVRRMEIDGAVALTVAYGQMHDGKMSISPTAAVVMSFETGIVEPADEVSYERAASVAAYLSAFLAALSARGTSTSEVKRSRLRREMDAKAAGAGGWEYRLLTLPEAPPKRAAVMGGTHASPRWHVRRGHGRRLPDGRIIPVRECEVGDQTRGGVLKDYLISESPSP